MFDELWNFLARTFGQASSLRGPLVAVGTILVLWGAYVLATRSLKGYLRRKAQKSENVLRFLFIWRYTWLGVAVVLFLIGFSGSLAALGISAAFLGMILGWSLQAPVTGIAAWLMIVLKRPFKIGDRIIVAGVTGDVIDISLTHIVLDQVGGTVGGEDKSGRGVLIPTAVLFQQIIYNYCFDSEYVLDEVPVLVTFESDLAEAERICRAAAVEVTAATIAATAHEPFTRVELADSGIRVRLRYKVPAFDRQIVSSRICRAIVAEFGKTTRVEFAYPHTEVVYRGGSVGGPDGPRRPIVST